MSDNMMWALVKEKPEAGLWMKRVPIPEVGPMPTSCYHMRQMSELSGRPQRKLQGRKGRRCQQKWCICRVPCDSVFERMAMQPEYSGRDVCDF